VQGEILPALKSTIKSNNFVIVLPIKQG